MSSTFLRGSSLRLIKFKAAPPTDSRVSRSTASHKKTPAEQEYRRRQAIERFPFLEALQHLHATPPHHSANSLAAQLTHSQRRALLDAIDHGRPIAGILARELKLAPWMTKHLQRHWEEFHDHDRGYGHTGWNIGALLATWTPETAPRTAQELNRLSSLTGFNDHEVLPFFHSTQAPLRSRDRRLLCQLLRDEQQYQRFWDYTLFLGILSFWIEQHTGEPICARVHELLGATTVTDWWNLSNRWHRINENLPQSLARTLKSAPASDPVTHFGLFDEPMTIGEFTFASLNNWTDLKAEGERMENCVAAYLTQCAHRQLALIHVAHLGAPAATLSVVRTSDPSTFRIAVQEAEGPCDVPPTTECSAAIQQFVNGVNAGLIPTRADALPLHSSRETLLASLFKTQPCVDYSSWSEHFDCYDYFNQHVRWTGARVFESYREVLEPRQCMMDSLYERALDAAFRYRNQNGKPYCL